MFFCDVGILTGWAPPRPCDENRLSWTPAVQGNRIKMSRQKTFATECAELIECTENQLPLCPLCFCVLCEAIYFLCVSVSLWQLWF